MKNKNLLLFSSLAAGSFLLPQTASSQDLFLSLDGLVAYYDFEQSGTAGLANQAPGFSGQHNGSHLGDVSLIAGAGAGFSGDAAYGGAVATNSTDRSNLLVGNALNVAKANTAATAGKGQFLIDSLSSRGTGADGGGSLGTAFTISSWFFAARDADNTSTTGDIIRSSVFETVLDGATNTNVFDISWGTTGNNSTYVPYLHSNAGSASTLADNQWHHVLHSVTTDGTTSTLRSYVNGELSATITAPTSAVDFRGLHIGAHRTGGRIFDGLIDETSAWNRPLDASEAFAVFNLGQNSQALTSTITSRLKADNADSLALGSSWSSGNAPATGDFLIFDSSFTQNTPVETGAALAVAGLRVGSGSGLIDLRTTAGSLSTGALGIDLAAASRDLRIESLSASETQNWNIAAGRSLGIEALAGAGEVTKMGAGSLRLAESGAFSGTLSIANGSAILTQASALPSSGTLAAQPGGILALRLAPGAFTGTDLNALMNNNLSGANLAPGALAGIEISGSETIATPLDGSRGLAVLGGGSLTLSAVNSYAGPTAIADAQVTVSNNATLGGSGTISLSQGSSLTFQNSADLNLGRAITGGGTLVHAGSGELRTGAAANRFDLDVSSGTFRVAEGAWATSYFSTPGQQITVRDGATLLNAGLHSLGGLGGTFHRPQISLEQGGTWQLNGEQYISASNLTMSGGTILQTASNLRLQGGTMEINASDSGSLITRSGSGVLTLFASPTFQVANGPAAVDFEIAAPIGQDGTQGFTKTGEGLMLVSANNTYSGTTTLSGGTLQVGKGGSTGSLGSGAIVNNGRLVIDRADSFSLANPVSGSGVLEITGSGVVTISGNNSHSGGTTLAGGTLLAASATALGTGTLSLQGGGLHLAHGLQVTNDIVLHGDASSNRIGGTIQVDYLVVGGGGGGGGRDASGGGGGGGVITSLGTPGFTAAAALPGTALPVTVGAGGAGGGVSSTGGAAGQGGNGGSSSLGTIVAQGGGGGGAYNTVGKDGASGGGGGRVNSGGAGISLQGFAGGTGSGGTNTGASTADAGAGGGGAGSPGANGVAGSANGGGKGGDGLAISLLPAELATALAIGQVSGGNVYFGGGGGGTPHRNGTNVPSGAGGLGGGGAGSLNSTTTFATPGTANTGGGGGASRSDNATRGIGGQGGSGVVVARYLGGPIATGGIISPGSGEFEGYTYHTFTTTGSDSLAFASNVQTNSDATISGTLSGTGGFTWNSLGTLTLTAANTHSGDTVVSGGTLALAAGGSLSHSTLVLNNGTFNVSTLAGGYEIPATAALAGSGTVVGDITVGGALAIGNSPGTLHFDGNLSLQGTSFFEITDPLLAAGSYDLATGSGTVTFGGALNLFFSGGTYADGTSVQLFDFNGGYAGTFSSLNVTGLNPGQSAFFDASTGFVTVIPEPSAALLGGIGLLLLLRRRR